MDTTWQNFSRFNVSNFTEVVHAPDIPISATLVVFIVAFAGFFFSLITTLSLLFTKEVQKGDTYITLSTMTFSEIMVYLTFLVLLVISFNPFGKNVPYLCLSLNTAVSLFKGFSLSLALYLTSERVIALSCPNLYRALKKRFSRHLVQAVLFGIDTVIYLAVNLTFGRKDSDTSCSTLSIYGEKIHNVMTTLRAITLAKMFLIWIMCIITHVWIRRKMRQVGQMANKSTGHPTEDTKRRQPPTSETSRAKSPGVMKITVKPLDSYEQDGGIFSQTASTSKMEIATTKFNTKGSPRSLKQQQIFLEKDVTKEENHTNSKNRCAPFWMRKSYKTVSYYLSSYIVIYLPSMVYMTTMVFGDGASEDLISRAINFLAPCIHSVVGSFIYLFRVCDFGQKIRSALRNLRSNPDS